MTVSDTDWRILANTDGMTLNGGKAYTVPIRLHGFNRTSMKTARGSGKRDTNLGHFLLANLANTVKCRYNAVFGVQEIDRVIAVTAL